MLCAFCIFNSISSRFSKSVILLILYLTFDLWVKFWATQINWFFKNQFSFTYASSSVDSSFLISFGMIVTNESDLPRRCLALILLFAPSGPRPSSYPSCIYSNFCIFYFAKATKRTGRPSLDFYQITAGSSPSRKLNLHKLIDADLLSCSLHILKK